MMSHSIKVCGIGALAFTACASTPGAKPSDMSIAQHEQAGAAHDQEAAPHATAYDPSAKQTRTHCGDPRRPCWESTVNPTEEHKRDADKHHRMAADHRRAAESLRAAEAQACAGLSEDDRDISPFDHRADIAQVAPYKVEKATGKNKTEELAGAVVTFRAVQGLTPEWLQRTVDCHIARNAALGNDVPEMPYCPLVPKGIVARVGSTGNGFAVTIQSNDPATAEEVLRRAQGLKSGG